MNTDLAALEDLPRSNDLSSLLNLYALYHIFATVMHYLFTAHVQTWSYSDRIRRDRI